MIVRIIPAIGMVALVIAGCSGYYPAVEYPQPRALGRNYEVPDARALPDTSDIASLSLEEPAGELTLQQALSLALLRNPGLTAYSWEIRAREAASLQASLWPNPEVGLEVENLAGTGGYGGFSRTETTIQLSQLIELAGKRSKRTRVAALESNLAAWDYEMKRLDVLTRVTEAFVDVLSAQERLALDEELIRLAQEFVDVVVRRVKAGAISPAAASRARVALSNARIDLDRTRQELEAARKRLAASWGSTEPIFTSVKGKLDTSLILPEWRKLSVLLARNPEVARWAVEMQRRQAMVELEEARAIPDPTVGGGIRYLMEDDDRAFVVGVSIPLNLFNRNQGTIEEARLRLGQAEWQRKATELAVGTRIAEAYQRLSIAYNEVNTLHSTVLPQAQDAFDTINKGYRLGKFGFLEVLDAQRTLFNARSRHLRSLTDYHQARAALERLIGQGLDSIQ